MNGWVIGYVVGGAVVVVVVVLLLLLIAGARRVSAEAEQIVVALNDARDGTAALHDVHGTILAAERIVGAAAQAREALAGGGS